MLNINSLLELTLSSFDFIATRPQVSKMNIKLVMVLVVAMVSLVVVDARNCKGWAWFKCATNDVSDTLKKIATPSNPPKSGKELLNQIPIPGVGGTILKGAVNAADKLKKN